MLAPTIPLRRLRRHLSYKARLTLLGLLKHSLPLDLDFSRLLLCRTASQGKPCLLCSQRETSLQGKWLLTIFLLLTLFLRIRYSLRLGHSSGLTVHWTVIQYLGAASLRQKRLLTVFACSLYSEFCILNSKGSVILAARPDSQSATFSGFIQINDTLIFRATESETKALFFLYIWAVDQHVGKRQKPGGMLGMGAMTRDLACQLLVEIACKDPDGLVGKALLEATDKGQKLCLIFGLHRLAAKNGKASYRGVIHRRKNLGDGRLIKAFTVGKAPCLGLKAALTFISAAADEKAHTNPLAVGYIAFIYFSVMHLTPLRHLRCHLSLGGKA